MGTAPSSPLFEDRLPTFAEGKSEPTNPSVDAQNVDTGQEPIEIIGEDNVSNRHQVLQSPKAPKTCNIPTQIEESDHEFFLKTPQQMILKKIYNVEEKLKSYHEKIEKFSGTNKEKQYRYLDEMLTRCMLELDEIDTMGLDTIRLARKAAVKKVQASVDLLESKIINEETKQKLELNEPMNVESSDNQSLAAKSLVHKECDFFDSFYKNFDLSIF